MSRAAIHAHPRREGSLDSRIFRDACRHYASGVAVATVRAEDESLHGLTVSSFTPVSIEPPLVLICVDHGCAFIQHFRDCTHFAISVLSESQRDIANVFAAKEQDRFNGVDWKLSGNRVPLLRGSAATFDCRLAAVVEAGDHAIFLGEVLDAESNGGKPLLYHDRQYRELL